MQVAATEKPGEKFGEEMQVGDKRMTTERCARLCLVAIANRLPEAQYTPSLIQYQALIKTVQHSMCKCRLLAGINRRPKRDG